MHKIFLKYMNNEIHQIPSTRGSSLLLFSNGSYIKGSDVYYFWEYVEKYKTEYLATSVRDAINNGVDTFVAKRRCRKGHFPIRNLDDECSECATAEPTPLDGRASPSTIMMRCVPDMIIDKEAAILIGFTVYRDGSACSRGHRSYRYVKNNTCVECHKLNKHHRG